MPATIMPAATSDPPYPHPLYAFSCEDCVAAALSSFFLLFSLSPRRLAAPVPRPGRIAARRTPPQLSSMADAHIPGAVWLLAGARGSLWVGVFGSERLLGTYFQRRRGAGVDDMTKVGLYDSSK